MARNGQDPAELRVLVVEDDRDLAESLRTLLLLCGYQVMVAYTSKQGIEAARKRSRLLGMPREGPPIHMFV